MKPLLILSLLLLIIVTGLTSFYLGGRNIVQRYEQSTNLLKDKSLEAFCADSGCQTIGLKGAMVGYASKKIDFLTKKGTHFDVLLTDSVRVDDSYSIAYFEEKARRGDMIYVVFSIIKSSGSNLVATDVYIEKTGILAKKRIVK